MWRLKSKIWGRSTAPPHQSELNKAVFAGLHCDLDFKVSYAKSFRTSTGLINKSIHPKVKSKQSEWGEHKGDPGIFPESGQTKPGSLDKKLASKVKGKCSGKPD
jgi:hypothetical protein